MYQNEKRSPIPPPGPPPPNAQKIVLSPPPNRMLPKSNPPPNRSTGMDIPMDNGSRYSRGPTVQPSRFPKASEEMSRPPFVSPGAMSPKAMKVSPSDIERKTAPPGTFGPSPTRNIGNGEGNGVPTRIEKVTKPLPGRGTAPTRMNPSPIRTNGSGDTGLLKGPFTRDVNQTLGAESPNPERIKAIARTPSRTPSGRFGPGRMEGGNPPLINRGPIRIPLSNANAAKVDWEYGNISRDEAEKILGACVFDAFLIRNSSVPGKLSFTKWYYSEQRFEHSLIENVNGSFLFDGHDVKFPSLRDLVIHSGVFEGFCSPNGTPSLF